MKYIYKENRSVFSKILGKVRNPETQYYRNFFDNVHHPPASKGKILMYVAMGGMFYSPIEILMYHLLRAQGFEVDYLIYDESIPINEVITKERVQKGKDKFWNRSVRKTKKILDAAKVEYKFITINSEIPKLVVEIDGLEGLFSYKYDNIEFGEIVKGVMYRYYKSLTFDNDALEVGKKFLVTALTNYFTIRKVTRDNNYYNILFSHGIYCTWQPLVEYCDINKLSYVCYDRGKTKGTFNFNMNMPSPVWDISAAWDRLKDYHLNDTEALKVEDYLCERELQSGDVYAYNFTEKEKDNEALRVRLGIKKGSKVVTVFTNLIWDAANVSRDIAFSSPLECIRQTVARYENNEDVHILIRTHPAEKVLGTKQRYGQLVRDLFTELPSNVTIIEPEDNINSFSILEISDIGVVHTSTVGLEMAIEGKPVILISETHYRGKGFTYDAESTTDFFTLLNRMLVAPQLLPQQIALAKKYFYIMMFEYQHKMPMAFTNGVFTGYGYRDFNALSESDESSINKIIDRIISGKMVDFIFRNDTESAGPVNQDIT